MNFLKTSTIWSNAELGIIKASVICSGITIGIYFHEYLQYYLPYFIILSFGFGIWSGILWLKKMKTKA